MNTHHHQPSSPSLKFGFEVELLLGGRKKAFSSWKALASDLSKRLSLAGIANHVHDDAKALENYQQWAIVREVTVPNQPAKGLWGIELVSPIYPSTWWYWTTEVELLFSTLKSTYVLAPSPNCSTHIHISGTPLPFLATELSELAKAALYFEFALDQLVPPERRGGGGASTSYWCQSIRASPGLRGLPLSTCLGLLEGAEVNTIAAQQSTGGNNNMDGSGMILEAQDAAVRALVQTVNLFPAASAYGKAHGKKKDFVRGKVYKWDFSGMLLLSSSPSQKKSSSSSLSSSSGGGGPRGTVEFRQAPGSRSAEDAKGWISVVLTLVACVTTTPSTVWMVPAHEAKGHVNSQAGGSLEELWGVLGLGAQVLGWEGVGAAAQIFAKRTP